MVRLSTSLFSILIPLIYACTEERLDKDKQQAENRKVNSQVLLPPLEDEVEKVKEPEDSENNSFPKSSDEPEASQLPISSEIPLPSESSSTPSPTSTEDPKVVPSVSPTESDVPGEVSRTRLAEPMLANSVHQCLSSDQTTKFYFGTYDYVSKDQTVKRNYQVAQVLRSTPEKLEVTTEKHRTLIGMLSKDKTFLESVSAKEGLIFVDYDSRPQNMVRIFFDVALETQSSSIVYFNSERHTVVCQAPSPAETIKLPIQDLGLSFQMRDGSVFISRVQEHKGRYFILERDENGKTVRENITPQQLVGFKVMEVASEYVDTPGATDTEARFILAFRKEFFIPHEGMTRLKIQDTKGVVSSLVTGVKF